MVLVRILPRPFFCTMEIIHPLDFDFENTIDYLDSGYAFPFQWHLQAVVWFPRSRQKFPSEPLFPSSVRLFDRIFPFIPDSARASSHTHEIVGGVQFASPFLQVF
jgi:hypothetical protein